MKERKANQKGVNVYQMVTDRIVESLEQGIVPWQKPWAVSGNGQCGAINYVTRKPYSFLNCLLLGNLKVLKNLTNQLIQAFRFT